MSQGKMRARGAVTVLRNLRQLFFGRRVSSIGTGIILSFVAVLILGPFLIPYSPYQSSGVMNSPPSLAHPFGTDYAGHDVLTLVIYGAYPSLTVGILSTLGATLIGLMVGVTAGYFSKLEGILLGSADVILTFPPLPLLIILALFFPQLGSWIIVLLMLVLWPQIARSIRSQVLSIRSRPYVEAAKTSGLNDLEIIFKIIIPEVISIAFAYMILTTTISIIIVTSLEFLGVGNPDVVSWGSILYWAQQFAFYSGDWWWVLAPGLAITLVTTSLVLIGFSVEEIMNPRIGRK